MADSMDELKSLLQTLVADSMDELKSLLQTLAETLDGGKMTDDPQEIEAIEQAVHMMETGGDSDA